MGYITKYGTVWGQIPQTAGRVFWVSPSDGYTVDGRSYRGADGNDGLSPERACRTINHVMDNLVTADVGDVVVLLPGTHQPQNAAGDDATVAVDTAGITITGLPSGRGNLMRQRATITDVSGDHNFTVTAANVEIAHLTFVPVTQYAGINLHFNADQLHIHDCSFDLVAPTVHASTRGIVAGAASNVLIDNCYFASDGAQGPGISLGTMLDGIVQNCVFTLSAGTWVSAMTQAATGRRVIIRGNEFHAGVGTITNGCLGTTGGEEEMAFFIGNHNSVSVTKMVDGYDSGDAVLAVNYLGTVGGGSGGTLVTATT